MTGPGSPGQMGTVGKSRGGFSAGPPLALCWPLFQLSTLFKLNSTPVALHNDEFRLCILNTVAFMSVTFIGVARLSPS